MSVTTPVFLGLSQQEIDRAYDQEVWAPNVAEVQARILTRSAEVARLTPPVTRRYGPADKQFVDIFAPAGARDAPVFIMIHGGAWRMAMREAFYGPAPAIISAGCVFAVVGFQCLPEISLPDMAGQIRAALAWIGREIAEFGGDGRNLRLIGHSSGAHLAAVMMTTDWTGLGLDPVSLRGATLLSGLYDLHPVMLSARVQYLKLSPDQETALSPMRQLSRLSAPVSIHWGDGESPEFQRQSRVFADAVTGMGLAAGAGVIQGRNHFEMLEALNDPEDPVVRAMLENAKATLTNK
jgi:arylformamidase